MKKKQNMKDTLYTSACGAWIGGTMTVPGVSGGSMAMILGIYDRLIASVNGIFKKDKFKESLIFLLKFMIHLNGNTPPRILQPFRRILLHTYNRIPTDSLTYNLYTFFLAIHKNQYRYY